MAQYQALAYEAIEDIQKCHKVPFLVGGSGLYVWAVLEGWKIPQVPPDAEFRQRLEEKARSGMKAMATSIASEGIGVEQHVTYGRRATQIVAFAEEKDLDLIVLSSAPLDPSEPGATWASISHQVAILSRRPVLLLK